MEPRARENKEGTKPPYRKVIANLRDCEERYQGLLNSISTTDDARLKSALSTLKNEVRHRRRLEAELLTAIESERERIGQDLHDDLCQRLSATAMMTSVIATRIGRNDSQAGVELNKIATLINDTIESCRLLARGLHPVTLAAKGLPGALDELAERMPPGINFRWPQGLRIALEPATALHLYRITEEAVGNAVKHSGAKNISVELDICGGRTVLVIQDDGKGFKQDLSSDGMGLRNIQYRASAIGANLTIGQRKGGGTRIRCRLPRPKARDLDPPRAK
ncbi:MAG: sensor histidine kinase [Chthoniobacterales bacterium]